MQEDEFSQYIASLLVLMNNINADPKVLQKSLSQYDAHICSNGEIIVTNMKKYEQDTIRINLSDADCYSYIKLMDGEITDISYHPRGVKLFVYERYSGRTTSGYDVYNIPCTEEEAFQISTINKYYYVLQEYMKLRQEVQYNFQSNAEQYNIDCMLEIYKDE